MRHVIVSAAAGVAKSCSRNDDAELFKFSAARVVHRREGNFYHLTRCTVAGDFELVQRVHSVLGVLKTKASQGQTVEEGRSVARDLKDRPAFPVRTQIEGQKHRELQLFARTDHSVGEAEGRPD
jgi:hypothetical protein